MLGKCGNDFGMNDFLELVIIGELLRESALNRHLWRLAFGLLIRHK